MLGLMWTHLAKADIEEQDQEHTLSLSWDLLGQHLHASFLSTYKATYHIPLHGDIYLRMVPVMEEPEDEDDTEDLDSEDDWEDIILEEEDKDEVDMDAEDGEDIVIPNLDVAMIGNLDFGTSYSEPASRNEAPNPKIGMIK
ncbi:hypothetical protein ARMGADRAFT_1040905 [Armillaria gallica]|uniref:Uncharacterized protein n=1 Tax=Armillaria gallica TaxID=47427 RepID=A0A2H3CJ00_ARMGA|nr:hypothetical protein ARMGADRAFT_1040996 [Armillaria gallica]PBK79317.1 hypothetical protein ARMGADRAFT_1040905 [Armillaria gallica]